MAYELSMPPAAEADSRSQEMIRVWIAMGELHCVLNIGLWEGQGLDERQAWGILLADMLHHIADAHKAEYGRDQGESIALIREALAAELDYPTSARLGEFMVERAGGPAGNDGGGR